MAEKQCNLLKNGGGMSEVGVELFNQTLTFPQRTQAWNSTTVNIDISDYKWIIIYINDAVCFPILKQSFLVNMIAQYSDTYYGLLSSVLLLISNDTITGVLTGGSIYNGSANVKIYGMK